MTKISISRIKKGFALVRHYVNILHQYRLLRDASSKRFLIQWKDRWIHLKDATVTTGFDRHYLFHTAWAARIVSELKPVHHIDVGSSLYFSCLVSAFVPITFLDIRPADLSLTNLASKQASLALLPYDDGSLYSVSCMHVIEHIGLGRYGDAFDPDGDLKAVAELKRVTALGGHLLFVVPVGGVARIQFNAHRIYTYQQVLEMFRGFQLAEFALIPDDGSLDGLLRHCDPRLVEDQRYGCGCFHFIKQS